MLNDVLSNLDDARETVIELQKHLVSIVALGPENADPGGIGEHDKALYIKDYLTGLGVEEFIDVNAPDERVACGYRPNFAAVFPGQNREKTLWVIGHMDIVPSGDLQLWNSDPFELKVEGDVLIGRGVEDNNQGIVSGVLAAKALVDTGVTPPINLGLLMVSDEETGSGFGLDYVLEHNPGMFGKDDLFLVPDFGNSESTLMEVAEKSMYWLKISVIGKQCHASTPDEGVNSLRGAAAHILALEELYETFNARDDLFDPPYSSFEPTRKELNVPNVNTVPGLDVFYLDCRVLPQYPLDDVLTEVARLGKAVEAKYGVQIEYEDVLKGQSAPSTPADSEIVTRLAKSIKTIYGADAEAKGIGGGTVAAFLRRRGFPAVVWQTCVHNAHQPNERSLISSQIGDAKVIADMLLNC